MIDQEQHTHAQPCTRCSPSGVFLAFDLVGSATFAKPYWVFPSCQQTSTVIASVDNALQVSAKTEPTLFSRLLESWDTIAAHMKEHPDILAPRMLSINATKYLTPRVKLYIRQSFVKSSSFSEIEPHLTLGGRIPIAERFRQDCERLWNSLLEAEHSGRGPSYCLLLYDLPTGAPGEAAEKNVSAKLYIMCQEIPRADSFVAQKLYDNCPVLEDAELVKYGSHFCPS